MEVSQPMHISRAYTPAKNMELIVAGSRQTQEVIDQENAIENKNYKAKYTFCAVVMALGTLFYLRNSYLDRHSNSFIEALQYATYVTSANGAYIWGVYLFFDQQQNEKVLDSRRAVVKKIFSDVKELIKNETASIQERIKKISSMSSNKFPLDASPARKKIYEQVLAIHKASLGDGDLEYECKQHFDKYQTYYKA